jgi:transcriptional regulator with XRE-family HTH domain
MTHMKRSVALDALPGPVQRALTKLGEDIGAARRRRRITMAIMAERAFITRKTLARVERGDSGVSLGIYATVLFVLGMVERLGDLVDSRSDQLGRMLQDERLPKRVRPRRRKAA